MDDIKKYILSVTCMAVLCGLTQILSAGFLSSPLIKLVTGLVMTVTALSPVLQWGSVDLESYLREFSVADHSVVEDAAQQAEETLTGIIIDRTQAYILDKARGYGADVCVDVEVSSERIPTPYRVIIDGDLSPYARQQLADMLARDLNIEEDNQLWI